MKKKFGLVFLVIYIVFGVAQIGHSTLNAVGPVFPPDAANPQYNGFPDWYQDTTGVTLELPNPPAGDGVNAPTMIFDPIVTANPFSAQIGFGTEAFYFVATSTIAMANANTADFLVGLEAAFAQGDAIDGDQITFYRTRIRIDAPVAGVYTITHPYGSKSFTVATPGKRAINDTIDIGVAPKNFAGAARSTLGPFLKATTMAPGVDPALWIGDGVTLTTVTGSPTNFNKFRVDGPVGSNLDGLGNDFVETTLFKVSGKIYTGTPSWIFRATYSRDALGATTVDVWAKTATRNVAHAITAQIAAEPPVTLTKVRNRFFAHMPYVAGVFPASVTVQATTNGLNPTILTQNITDQVTITRADYSVSTKTLTINAESSDLQGAPTLTVSGKGWALNSPLTAGALSVLMNEPPPTVRVGSSAGGADSAVVKIIP